RRRLEAKSVTEQANEWLLILENKGADANAAFSDWLRESPLHVQAYLRAATLDAMIKRVDPDRSLETPRSEPGAAIPDIGPDFDERYSRRGAWRIAASIAAVGALLAGLWLTFEWVGNPWKTYRTEIGEQRSVELEDGSTLTLNTDSRVQVHFTGGERQLRL